MIDAPKIDTSSENERRIFIKEKYPCIADCDMCGLCKVFHGKNEFQFISALNRILSLVGAVALVGAVILGIIIAARITGPISGVIAVAGNIAKGNYKERVNTDLKERETYELAEAVNHMTSV